MLEKYRQDLPYYVASKVTQVLSWLYIIWFLTGNLSVEQYGEYSLLYSLLILLAIVTTSWLNSSVIRHLPEYNTIDEKRQFQAIINTLARPTILGGLGVYLIILTTLMFTGVFDWSPLVFAALTVAFVFHATFALVIIYLSASRSVKSYAYATVGQIVIFASLMWFAIDRYDNKIAVIFISLSLSYLPSILTALNKTNTKRIPVAKYAKEYMRYGLPLLLLNSATLINMYGDQLMIRLLASKADVGQYSANYVFAERSVLTISSVMVTAYLPILFRMWEDGEKKQAYLFIWKIAAILLAVLIPIVLILTFYGKEISSLIIDPRFAAGSVIIPIVGLASIFNSLAAVFADVLTIQKRTGILAIIYLSVAALNIVLNYFLIPQYGFIAAAYTTLVSCIVLFAIVLSVAQFHGRIFSYVTRS